MNTDRNPYIITKALNSNLRGSVIIAISGYLVTTVDAIVVSWFLGRKALSAVNIVIPLLTLFTFLMIMLATGVAVSISRSLGDREGDKVNLSSSASITGAVIIGLVAGGLTYLFSSEIIRFLVHGDEVLYQYAYSYLKTFCYAVPFMITSGVVGAIVRTDGNSRLISVAAWTGIIINFGLDVLFVRFLDMGIEGAAWASAINYVVMLIISLFHFISADNTIRWSSAFKEYFYCIIRNCRLGFSTSLTNLLMAVSLFVINGIMLHYRGNEGIYCWAVCYQIFLILQMLISGLDSSIFALGGTLLEEDDVVGLDFLYRRTAVYMIVSVVLLSAIIIIFPELFGSLFGSRGNDHLRLLPSVLKIFSLFLFPYAMVVQVRSIYTILGRSALSLSLCVCSFGLMMAFVFGASVLDINPVWWSFPVSAWLILIFLLIYTFIIHSRNKRLRMFSLIPKTITDPGFSVSLPLNIDSVKNAEADMTTFLRGHDMEDEKIEYEVAVTGKIMESILEELIQENKGKRYFDLNVRLKGSHTIVILKDDGNRIEGEDERKILEEISNESTSVNSTQNPGLISKYFYINDQNIFTLIFGES